MRVALDSETSGVDYYKGSKVFFVTVCYEDGTQTYYEWEVSPKTRLPNIPDEDVEEISHIIRDADELILHNARFDYSILKQTNPLFTQYWDWNKVQDTLVAGHVLSSNTHHDLTSMGIQYLGHDITKYETSLQEVCQSARRWCRSHFPHWRIADEGLEEMPSVKGSSSSKKGRGSESGSQWRADSWLPRAILTHYQHNPTAKPVSTRKPTPKQLNHLTNPRCIHDLADWRPFTGCCKIVNRKYDDCDVVIDRTSKWGNPFTHLPLHKTTAKYQVSTRKEAVAKYKEWLLHPDQQYLLADLTELDNKTLGCVCKAPQPKSPGAVLNDATACHGDILAELLKKWRNPKWDTLPTYANADSETTMGLWFRVEELLNERKLWAIYRTQMRLPQIVCDMADRGVTTSGKSLDHVTKEFKEASERAGNICVNIASSYDNYQLDLPRGAGPNESLRTFFFDKLKVPPVFNKKAKTDAPTLNQTAMEHYLVTLPSKSPALLFVKTLLGKRKRDTSLAFMVNYKRFWTPLKDDNGLIVRDWFVLHPSLNQCGTNTLRFSCNNPNGQNISVKGVDTTCTRCQGDGCTYCKNTGTIAYNVRYCICPAPGREFYSCDGQNLELRIPAYRAGEKEMIGLFERPKDPPYYGSNHLLNFSAVYPDIWQKELATQIKNKDHVKTTYKDTLYQWCKNGGFALQYSAGQVTADAAFHKQGAYALLKRRFAKLHGEGGLNQWCIEYAEKHGYIETMVDPSMDPNRGYPLLCKRTEFGKILSTIPLSYLVQGTACHWIRMAMIRVYDFFQGLNRGEEFAGRKWPGGYYLVLQIHDENLYDLPNGWHMQDKLGIPRSPNQYDYNLPVMREVQRLMAKCGEDIGVPTPVSLSFHPNNWSEGVNL